MKLVLGVFAIFTSMVANAEVAKPRNTSETAEGVAVIQGVQFQYKVDDRAWITTGSAERGLTVLQARKSFLLRFESLGNERVVLRDSTINAIEQDAALKCLELGQLEYPGQVKALSGEMKAELATELKDERFDSLFKKRVTARFVCLVKIDVTNK